MSPGNLSGMLEFCGESLIGGWAIDTSRKGRTATLDIFIDGDKVARIRADSLHSDTDSIQQASQRHGFRYLFPYRFKDGRKHTVSVRFADTEIELKGSPGISRIAFDLTQPLPQKVLDHARDLARARALSPTGEIEHLNLPSMRIHIICYEDLDSWILGKISRKLCEHLNKLGMHASVGKHVDPEADVNHHVIYWGYEYQKQTVETVMLTHFENFREVGKVRQQLTHLNVEMGICMSYESVCRLSLLGIPRDRLCYVSPAHDGLIQPRKVRIGVTTRLYPDGCKREHLIEQLAGKIHSEHFQFVIMGSGWDEIINTLERSGLEVEYHPDFDLAAYRNLIPSLDYYLYTGMDEGSMGFIDAVAAAIPTIATPQGYHLDVPGGITHAFSSFDELLSIFRKISASRSKRSRLVSGWTWDNYAYRHALIWAYLLSKTNRHPIDRRVIEQLPQVGVSEPDS